MQNQDCVSNIYTSPALLQQKGITLAILQTSKKEQCNICGASPDLEKFEGYYLAENEYGRYNTFEWLSIHEGMYLF